MREIKFRCWEGKLGKMSYDPIITNWSWYTDRDDFDIDISFKDDPKGKVLEQFTGLHDKNGTEIYEGDILDNSKNIIVVKWDEVTAGFCWGHGIWKPGNGGINVEVLGNIHENRELIKGGI